MIDTAACFQGPELTGGRLIGGPNGYPIIGNG